MNLNFFKQKLRVAKKRGLQACGIGKFHHSIVVCNGKIGYVDIPKAACTAIKTTLYALEYGSEEVDGEHNDRIHNLTAHLREDMSKCQFKFTVVRDPVRRFLSAYANRVVYYKECSRKYVTDHAPEQLTKIKVFDPDISKFIANFDDYMNIPSINHHFKPMMNFIGKYGTLDDLKVYDLNQLNELEHNLGKLVGTNIKFPRLQTGGPKLTTEQLTNSEITYLQEYYSSDYEFLKSKNSNPKK